MKPLLIGESNPYGADPYYALYPSPVGCAGWRLCHTILRMNEDDYLEQFERINLCPSRWSMKVARLRVGDLSQMPRRQILLGSKVAAAFNVPFVPFEISEDGTRLVLPHPSGLCRLWSEPNAFDRARKAVERFIQ